MRVTTGTNDRQNLEHCAAQGMRACMVNPDLNEIAKRRQRLIRLQLKMDNLVGRTSSPALSSGYLLNQHFSFFMHQAGIPL